MGGSRLWLGGSWSVSRCGCSARNCGTLFRGSGPRGFPERKSTWDQALARLERDSGKAAREVETVPAPELRAPRDETVESEILRTAGEFPGAALMSLSAALERELRDLLESVGHLPEASPFDDWPRKRHGSPGFRMHRVTPLSISATFDIGSCTEGACPPLTCCGVSIPDSRSFE